MGKCDSVKIEMRFNALHIFPIPNLEVRLKPRETQVQPWYPLLHRFKAGLGVEKSGKMDNFGDIPEDTIINIFLRLPVKSLLRFKCVCKSWYSIITSSKFIYEHLDMALADNRKSRLLVMHHASETSDFFLFTNDQLTTRTHLTIPKKQPCYFTIIGHCHGLLCLFDYNSELCLWNPATREIKYIPSSPIPPPPTVHGDEDAEFGFGFDWKTRDYKVVKLLRNYYDVENRNNYGYQVEVYNLSTNSWREIDVNVPFHGHEMSSPTAYMNGTYYWWVWRIGEEEEEGRIIGVILYFDMSNEQFGTIHLPKMDFPLNEVKILSLCFTEYDGSLAVIFYVEHENDTWSELWTMNGHGMAVTWTKQFSVGRLEGLLHPIGSYNNRILFINGLNFIIPYDHETRSVQIAIPIDPEKRMVHHCGATTAAFYTESLVFPGWK